MAKSCKKVVIIDKIHPIRDGFYEVETMPPDLGMFNCAGKYLWNVKKIK